MITYDEYIDTTLELEPVYRYNDGYIWTEDYWLKGTLVRFAGTKGCTNVQRTDMMTEIHITR